MNYRFVERISIIVIIFAGLSCTRQVPVFGENGMIVSTSRHASQVVVVVVVVAVAVAVAVVVVVVVVVVWKGFKAQ